MHPNRASGIEESLTKAKFKVIKYINIMNVKGKKQKKKNQIPVSHQKAESKKKFKIYYMHCNLKDSQVLVEPK